MIEGLCPTNGCMCRCDPGLGDYCHYDDRLAEVQSNELLHENKLLAERLRNNAETGTYDGADYLKAADLIERLHAAIRETIENNLHLADGEDCTLIKLKRAINYGE